MTVFGRWSATLREFVFPSGCAVCGAPLLDGEECALGVCAECAAGLLPEAGPRCGRCGRPLVSEKSTCMECRDKSAPAFDGARALYRYGGDARKLLVAYKFGIGRAAATFIARRFVDAVAEMEARDAVIVPVPPRAGKLKEKGWDQMDLIARAIRREGFAVSRCLRRLPSRSQKELDRRARSTNLAGKIVCGSPPERAVLIDDVITTGATLEACARSLKDAGSAQVFAVALCYD